MEREQLFAELMSITDPRDRLDAMREHRLEPADFGRTARQMGVNPRALATNPRATRARFSRGNYGTAHVDGRGKVHW